MLELVKGKMYRQKVNSQQGYEDWEYTGITKEVPNGELWYAFENDRGCYYFDKTDLEDFVEIKMFEPRKRIAIDGKSWWCVFDVKKGSWSTYTCFGRYKLKRDCQFAINKFYELANYINNGK